MITIAVPVQGKLNNLCGLLGAFRIVLPLLKERLCKAKANLAAEILLNTVENLDPAKHIPFILERAREIGLATIMTYRSQNGQGNYPRESLGLVIQSIRQSIIHGADFVDIEWGLLRDNHAILKMVIGLLEKNSKVRLIISHHNYDKELSTAEIDQIIQEMLAFYPRAIPKVALRGNPIAALRQWLGKGQDVVILGIGEDAATRYLQPCITFARLNEDWPGSAAGQPTVEDLLDSIEEKSS